MKRTLWIIAAGLAPTVGVAQARQDNPPVTVPLPAARLPLKHAPEPTSPDITAKDLMTRLYIFSDDSMQGREAGTIGNVRGTTYIAHEVERMGLVPAGDGGTYFQTIPLKTRSVDPASTIVVAGTPLAFGSEWAVLGNKSLAKNDLPVVYGGDISADGALVSPQDAAGKLVVFMLPRGAAPANRMMEVATIAQVASAVALIAPDIYMTYFSRPSSFVDDPASAPPGAAPTNIFVSGQAAAKLFNAPVDQLKAGTRGKSVALSVTIHVDPVPYPARNVVAILPGSDPVLAKEYVAIGAHNDHIGMELHPVDHDSVRLFNHIVRPGGAENAAAGATPEQQAEVNRELAAWRAAHPGEARADSISNGADDDGSGSVGVLEIAEKLASLKGADRPKRSILFVWHVGEEKGLLGSTYFTDNPTVPRDSIVAQLNMDMIGRGDAWDVTGISKDGVLLHGNPNYLQIVGSRRLSTELGDLIEKVNAEDRHGLSFDYGMDTNGHPANIYCRSDHYEYARYGIPIAFFTTGGHSDYHQVTDEAEYIDYDHMARVANFVEDVALHVANLDHRPVVDHPKPNPQGVCQQ